ncbi:hypothetical protein ACTV70_002385 [Cronobacter dublinensis]
MWREAKLAFSDAFSALDCAIVPAHPWIYGIGQQTENGAYLSPANAVAYLAGRLAGAADVQDVVIFLVTGQTQDDFIQRLDALTEVFPAPAFTQVSRLARSAAELATVRMQLLKPVNDALGYARHARAFLCPSLTHPERTTAPAARKLPTATPETDPARLVALTQPRPHKIKRSQTKTALHRTRLQVLDRKNFSVLFFYK